MKLEIVKYIQTLIFLSAIGCCFLTGCDVENNQRVILPSQKDKALKSYNSGLAALMREPTLNPDTIWILQQINKANPDDKLSKFIEEKIAVVPNHPALCAIIPNYPRLELPEQLPSGFAKYRTFLLAPFGMPADRAISFIEKFLSKNEKGYIRTHQFIVLIWAEQMGLNISEHLQNKKKELLQEILMEHQKDDIFSDLYAERAAMLINYGNPNSNEMEQWINKIIGSQLKDGNWGKDNALVNYDGESVMLSIPKQHKTVLSLWALHGYLNLE